MKVIGIDPGYAIAGVGIVENLSNKLNCHFYTALTTTSDMSHPKRLKKIYDGLIAIIDHYKPDFAAVESLFFNKNAKTAILVGQARGVILLACVNSGIEVFEYTPIQVKNSVTGYGKAEKKQVQKMTSFLLGLKDIPKPDDAADALAVGICHLNSYRGVLK